MHLAHDLTRPTNPYRFRGMERPPRLKGDHVQIKNQPTKFLWSLRK